jgi:hypothetical protein
MVAQVRRDFTIRPALIEEIFGYISATDKKLHWIEGTDQRFQALQPLRPRTASDARVVQRPHVMKRGR